MVEVVFEPQFSRRKQMSRIEKRKQVRWTASQFAVGQCLITIP
jgi:hypothetical protein